MSRGDVLADVYEERDRQEAIGHRKRAGGIDWRSCADPQMAGGDTTRFLVLGEEVGEVANAVLEAGYGSIVDDEHLREELVQVAAVAVAWVEAIDARTWARLHP
jgi:hypothetical protein